MNNQETNVINPNVVTINTGSTPVNPTVYNYPAPNIKEQNVTAVSFEDQQPVAQVPVTPVVQPQVVPTVQVPTPTPIVAPTSPVQTVVEPQIQPQVAPVQTVTPVEQAQPVVVPVQQVAKPVNNGTPSIIEMYGEILTDKEYVTNPAIAREEEISKMVLALITPDKSALLVGKPGIGKTALVEGLAYRIKNGNIPDALKGWKIIKINLPALLGKINVNGVEVSKLQLLIDEIDNVEKTILFIDEVHLLVAKNNASLDVDFANMLKPYLDRGRILMIGATTSEEYEAYILRDRAFVRRFIKIDIAEAQGEDVVKICLGTVPKFEKRMGVKIAYTDFQQEKIFEWIVEHTSEYKRLYEIQNRYPDICLTLISSAFSYAVFENSQTVTLKHFYLAMKNTNTIYPDAREKALIDFKQRFANMCTQEGIDIDALDK